MSDLELFLYALEPTHIGAGGYRLGRVDNTILRDAATGLPKIPGSSLNGAARAAAVHLKAAELEPAAAEQLYQFARAEQGQSQERPYGGDQDPVARVFGYADPRPGAASRIGTVAFADATILAFPVPTMGGPRWVTTPSALSEAGAREVPELTGMDHVLVQEGGRHDSKLNLGWLLVDTEPARLALPDAAREKAPPQWLGHIERNLVLVHEDLFPSLVNANLETRTSVTIDFETGAAAEGLLFTYEAAPRATLYRSRIHVDAQRPGAASADEAQALVQRALEAACEAGLGGMTTRGFGRMATHWGGAHDPS